MPDGLILNETASAGLAQPAASKGTLILDNSANPQIVFKDDANVVVVQLDNRNTVVQIPSKDFQDGSFTISDISATSKALKFSLSGMTAAVILTLLSAQSTSQTLTIPNITGADTLMTLALAQAITGAKTFGNSGLLINNPAGTFQVTITPSAEVASRVLTIPLLGGADTIDTLGLAQTITGVKTMTNPTTAINTNTVPSMTITPAGTVLSSPVAGAVETDAAAFYKTNNTTEGRFFDDGWRFFRLTANATPFTSITDFFGANDGIGFPTNAVLEIEWHCFFAIAALSTQVVTWTIVNTQTTTNMVANWAAQNAIANGATQGVLTGATLVTQTGASVALPNTGVMVIGNHYHIVRAVIETATAGNVRLRCATASTATVGPLRDSWFRVRRLPALNAGTFVA